MKRWNIVMAHRKGAQKDLKPLTKNRIMNCLNLVLKETFMKNVLPLVHQKMLDFVIVTLEASGRNRDIMGNFPFRKRSDHILRVYQWASRLTEGRSDVDGESVLVAALFHDSGYANTTSGRGGFSHGHYSGLIAREYLVNTGYASEKIDLICHLVENHSNKDLLKVDHAPLSPELEVSPELEALMEADLLDETGAMSIVWDCLSEGINAQKKQELPSFESCLAHIENFTLRDMANNPMRSPRAKTFWTQRQDLVETFVAQLRESL